MDITALEQLPRLLAQGRREGQRLAGAVLGRHRERAIRDESLPGADEIASGSHRLLRGNPTLSLAALLAERGLRSTPVLQAVLADTHPSHAHDALSARLARWIPRFELLQQLAPNVDARVHAPVDEHFVWTFVLEVTCPRARLVDRAAIERPHGRRLLVADDADLLLAHATHAGPWIACAADAATAARVRRAMLAARGAAPLDIDNVGATPGEWARRHVGTQPVAAMEAALAAFGATSLAQTSAGTTPTGRRRAGMEVLLGECITNDARTLVWVDAPDRRTGDATLCRAILQRERAAPPWDRVVVLGWQFAPAFAQHFALRDDARIDALAIGLSLRTPGQSGVRVDPNGFRSVPGLASAWIERRRSDDASEHEWLAIRLDDNAACEDWSVDPAHDGDVFRGTWHVVRDGTPGQRSVRLKVPWRAGPRRVCVRAIDPAGEVSEVIAVVRERERTHPAAPADAALC